MMNIIVFSKDRACQLELFLRSMRHFFVQFNNFTINVLYTYSDEEYRAGYEMLISDLRTPGNVFYVKHGSFKGCLMDLTYESNPYTVFFVDDMVWKGDFSLEEQAFLNFANDSQVLCLSLRLMQGLKYCYPLFANNDIPEIDRDNKWEWQGLNGDYGYPMSLDGHIFRTKDIIPLLRDCRYEDPNQLEAQMALHALSLNYRPKMICCDVSPVMNLPLNCVQTSWENRHGLFSARNMNMKFLLGNRISTENIYGKENRACHQLIDIRWDYNSGSGFSGWIVKSNEKKG